MPPERGVVRRGMGRLWPSTEAAGGFFAKAGLAQVARDAVSHKLTASRQFRALCPSSAVRMALDLDDDPAA